MSSTIQAASVISDNYFSWLATIISPYLIAIWRVEMWRGSLGLAYLYPALSFAGVSLAAPCSVSTSRSSNLDMRISRIRLTEEASRLRPRKAGCPL